jgi:hypothetical protein
MALSYFLVFDSAAEPDPGDEPIFAFGIDAAGVLAPGLLALSRSHFGDTGLRFEDGFSWAISSTPEVYTVPLIGTTQVTVNAVLRT